MKPRHITRAAIVAGWLTGLALILAGLPLWAALAVLTTAIAGALAWARWGAGVWPGLRTAVQLRRLLKRAVKIGGGLERA
jgi:hypothetical protein